MPAKEQNVQQIDGGMRKKAKKILEQFDLYGFTTYGLGLQAKSLSHMHLTVS